ncbi:MAG TPA: peptide deformylase [Cyanobacteria bacterium UBA9971]|nr:peptide deformylase [Cyanobacteria bacterium UBA9971]
MTVLKVITYGNNILRTPSKEVHKISAKIQKLIDDMFDTMYANNGVGLAAPQVGYNYRIFVLDDSGEKEQPRPKVFINPKIIKKHGAINSYEGCLSFPDVYINVRRCENVIIKAKDIKGRPFTLEATGGILLARAIQHEYDHLEGNLFIDHTRNRFETENILQEKGLPALEPDNLLEEAELEEKIQENEVKNPPVTNAT